MKLYTEEQLKMAMKLYNETSYSYTEAIEKLTPIELPSDEEIDKKFEPRVTMYELGYRDGAKWVIEQIKQQGK